MDDNNFVALDDLLAMLQRPPNPKHDQMSLKLCWKDHDKDAECDKCTMKVRAIEDDEGEQDSITSSQREEDLCGNPEEGNYWEMDQDEVGSTGSSEVGSLPDLY